MFGRPGAPRAPIHLAVAASCAVPGYFAPVRIGGRSYIDGGVHSPTNAAVLRGTGLDLVVVISPMSGSAAWRPDFYAATRRHAARLLKREVAALRAAGIRTVVFEPGRGRTAGHGRRHDVAGTAHEVLQQSFLGAGARAAEPEVAETPPAEVLRKAAGAR